MALVATLLLCPFIITSNIFTLKKDIAKTHYNNAGLNIPDNAPLGGLPSNPSQALVSHGPQDWQLTCDVRLSKMEAAIENIVSFVAVGNLAVNQLMECEVTAVVTAKAMFTEEPKWTMVMAKNMR